jgi:sortase (surface protein transpeptidase)
MASADAAATTAVAYAAHQADSPPWKRIRSDARRWFVALDVAAVTLLLMATLARVDRIGREDSDDPEQAGLAAGSPSASVRPQRLLIESIGVEAEIVAVAEIDPAARMPLADPWRVAWAEGSAAPGLPGNVVMAGHRDYWAIGPAVFWDLRLLAPGDRIVVAGDDGRAYRYEVAWVRHYEVDQLTAGPARAEVVGPTDDPALTLITEGGVFSFQEGEYLGRTVVRASLIGVGPAEATPGTDAMRLATH